jgi:hypothetical protein
MHTHGIAFIVTAGAALKTLMADAADAKLAAAIKLRSWPTCLQFSRVQGARA